MAESNGYLLTGGSGHQLLPALRHAILHATEVEIAVSFIKYSGLELIFSDLEAALQSERGTQLTLLTSDYLNVTDPRALRKLMLLAERGANIRIFQADASDSFHLKAYIFVQSGQGQVERADAFVGSSNISRIALTDGLEWNYHIDYPNDGDSRSEARLNEIRHQFRALLELPQVKHLSYEWIEQYEQRYKKARKVTPIIAVAPGSDEPEPEIPKPRPHQQEALDALSAARARGLDKGLVVLATGMGKTYLAAFDVVKMKAKRTLFVAHREEILLQAEASFLTVLPNLRIGRYTGKQKDAEFDLLFASVQTLGREEHLGRFPSDYFDYLVVDEFHHAAANSYQRLIEHFMPKFMLGLTATPDRTDRSDILRLCDYNLIFRMDLFAGINEQQLCPFLYFGIYDAEVDYEHIPWRNGRFDPEKLSNKLATLGRARHALKEWQDKAKVRTLAFCASRSHANYMASYFTKAGIAAASVHTESDFSRSEALEQLESGKLSVLFTVDLFNEGVDLPSIDTVMMLRPTESKILFLQQLGRGLRLSNEKEHLIVLDFVGNHHSFLNRPELLLGCLFDTAPSRQQLIKAVKEGHKLLPDGCFVNYDLQFVEFLESLTSDNLMEEYFKLKESLKRRPTLVELWKSGSNLSKLRQHYGSWWEFLDEISEASGDELLVIESFSQWFRDLTVTSISKSYKLVLLQTLLDQHAMPYQSSVQNLAAWSYEWFMAHPQWQADLPGSLKPLESVNSKEWLAHWRKMPVNYWCTAERSGVTWFNIDEINFGFLQTIAADQLESFQSMTQEILTWRLVQYAAVRLKEIVPPAIVAQSTERDVVEDRARLPFFPNIKIACGHFKTGRADAEEFVVLPAGFGRINPERHFIARASGNSMNGGKSPIYDGDYLLLEQITPENAGKISNETIAIERQEGTGESQYLLRKVLKNPEGSYTLRASNPDYDDMLANEDMVTFARLKGKIDPLELFVGKSFMREEIPSLFGVEFNPGNWQAGHIVLTDQKVQVLLVTLNKQGKSAQHRYHDYFIDEKHFHWQSQNSTKPEGKRGQQVIHHSEMGYKVYLFVRQHKLLSGKAAPFQFYGEVEYQKHFGSAPMSVEWRLIC